VATKLLLLDCDSTLSSIEGIDELGRLRGPETFKAVEDMTNAAMDGGTPMEAIFAKRLDIIKPTKAELEAIGAKYIATVEPTAKATLDQLRAPVGRSPSSAAASPRPSSRSPLISASTASKR